MVPTTFPRTQWQPLATGLHRYLLLDGAQCDAPQAVLQFLPHAASRLFDGLLADGSADTSVYLSRLPPDLPAEAVLLRLDDTRFISNQGETEADRLALVARVERLTAEAEGRPIAMPEEILRKAPQLAEDELALYQSRQGHLQSEQRTLGEQLRHHLQTGAEQQAHAGLFVEAGIFRELIAGHLPIGIEHKRLHRLGAGATQRVFLGLGLTAQGLFVDAVATI